MEQSDDCLTFRCQWLQRDYTPDRDCTIRFFLCDNTVQAWRGVA